MAQPLRGVRPAGLLPYYPPARFVSQAEQAAEKLPEQIKSQSLKNSLLRQGAKPAELEYAGLDDFIAKQAGPVRREDVLDFLKREGPLGKLKRVEQRYDPDAQQEPKVGIIGGEHAEWYEDGLSPQYAKDVRAPFDASSALPRTMYSDYTVPGQKGDFTGYREALIEDPKNRSGGGMLGGRPPSEDDRNFMAHANRRLPELYAQSAAGQPASDEMSAILGEAQMRGMLVVHDTNNTPFLEPDRVASETVDAHSADYWARYNEYPDRIAVQNIQSDVGQRAGKSEPTERFDPNMTMEQANALIDGWEAGEIGEHPLLNQAGQMVGHPDFDPNFHPGGDIPDEPPSRRAAQSPLAKDDNWKNLMARHIALQSIAGGGKPITVPTGRQMVEVEGFGMGTHGNDTEAAIRAASAYNEDLVRRLQKIFRGLDPNGASVQALKPADHSQLTTSSPAHLIRSIGLPDTQRLYVAAAADPTGGKAHELIHANDMASRSSMSPESLIDVARQIRRQAIDEGYDDDLWWAGLAADGQPERPSDPTPGWTIRPSPEAVRAALERGLPIMSLAPMLLAPAQEDQ